MLDNDTQNNLKTILHQVQQGELTTLHPLLEILYGFVSSSAIEGQEQKM